MFLGRLFKSVSDPEMVASATVLFDVRGFILYYEKFRAHATKPGCRFAMIFVVVLIFEGATEGVVVCPIPARL